MQTAALNLEIAVVNRGSHGSKHHTIEFCRPDQASEVETRLASYYESNPAAGTALDVRTDLTTLRADFATYLSKIEARIFTIANREVEDWARSNRLVHAVSADYDGTRYTLTDLGRYVVGK